MLPWPPLQASRGTAKQRYFHTLSSESMASLEGQGSTAMPRQPNTQDLQDAGAASPQRVKAGPGMVMVRQGSLLKERDHMSGWRPRVFRLEGSRISYFISDSSSKVRGAAQLGAGCGVRPLDAGYSKSGRKAAGDQFYPFLLTMSNSHKSWRLAANSEEERTRWVEALSNAISRGGAVPGTGGTGGGLLVSSPPPKPGDPSTPMTAASQRSGTRFEGDDSSSDDAALAQQAPPRAAAATGAGTSPAAKAPAAAVPGADAGSDFDPSRVQPALPPGEWGALIRRGFDRLRAEADDRSRWTPNGEADGVRKFVGKGAGATGRGEGFVPFSREDIMDMLVDISNRGETDEQFERGHVVERFNANATVTYFRFKSPSMFIAQRDMVNATAWYVEPPAEGGTLYIMGSSMEHPECPPDAKCVRAHCDLGGWIIRPRVAQRLLASKQPIPPGTNLDAEGCDCTYLVRTDLKGDLPTSIVAGVVAKQAMIVAALRKALVRKYTRQGLGEAAGQRTSCAKGAHGFHSFARAPPAELEAAKAAWAQQHAGAASAPAAGSAEADGAASGESDKSPAAHGAATPAPSGGGQGKAQAQGHSALASPSSVQGSAGAMSPAVDAVVHAVSAPDKPWKRRAPALVLRAVSFLLALAMPVAVLAASLVLAGPSAPATTPGEWVQWVLGGEWAHAPASSLMWPALLTLLAAYMAGVAMVRAWLGASWMTSRRRMLITTWDAPKNGNIMGSLEVDVGPLQTWMAQVRQRTGVKVTYTHAVIKAVGLALRACPGLNGHIACGEYWPADSVDVGCLVATERDENDNAVAGQVTSPVAGATGAKKGRTYDLANALLQDVDGTPVATLAEQLKVSASKIRSGKDKDYEGTKPLLRMLPNFLIRFILHDIVGFLGNSLGCAIPALGVKPYMFGAAMVTSVGMMGLDMAWAPFTPWANTPLIVTIGAVKDRVVAVDGSAVVRPILMVTAVVDHRYLDGADGANVARVVKTVLEHPELLDKDYSRPVDA